jgi:hypothetical protein
MPAWDTHTPRAGPKRRAGAVPLARGQDQSNQDFTKSAREWIRALLFVGAPPAAPPCFGRFFPLAGCELGCAGFFPEGWPAATS